MSSELLLSTKVESEDSKNKIAIYSDFDNTKHFQYVVMARDFGFQSVGSDYNLAELVASTVHTFLQKQLQSDIKVSCFHDMIKTGTALAEKEALFYNKETATRTSGCKVGACSLEICVFHDGKLYGNHIGDFRTYTLDKNHIFSLLTEDETGSWDDYRCDRIKTTIDDIKVFPGSKRVKNAIGLTQKIKKLDISNSYESLREFTHVLIVSPTIYRALTELEIRASLSHKTPEKCIEVLLERATNPAGMIPVFIKNQCSDDETARSELALELDGMTPYGCAVIINKSK